MHSEQDLETAGLYDYLDEGAIVAAEWSENIGQFAVPPNIRVHIRQTAENERVISIEGITL